jgi:gluconokinase
MSIVVMGVSGCGKTTIAQMIAAKLGVSFFDADDFHPQSNIDKMASGTPLTDIDRQPWLETLAQKLKESETQGRIVLACSALKQSYRNTLNSRCKHKPTFIYLKGSKSVLSTRLQNRAGHFMPDTLLDSQLATLEEPHDAIIVDIDQPANIILTQIMKNFNEPTRN